MSTPQVSDFVALRAFPSVITGAQIRELRAAPNSARTRDFVSGYLAFDARSSHALNAAISSLAHRDRGGAFWLNGVYGAGKSHLLGLVALLCDGVAHAEFGAIYPELRPHLDHFGARLTVSVALDEWGAARFGLEEIFWRELEKQIALLGGAPFCVQRHGSRAEAFAVLQEKLTERGLEGLVVCFDELSLFLGGRGHRELQEDAAFLQFVGQHCARSPLWVFCALQKTIEDIGPLEPYALGQIRDRFKTLPLSLAHLPLLVSARLVQVRDERALRHWCAQSYEEMENRLPRLDFGPQDWRSLFPFHPATVSLLDAVTARFFSRTRSAALFCAHTLKSCGAASERIAPDAIWDYFEPEIAGHPDLRALGEVWGTWNASASALAPRNTDLMRRVMKFLLVCKVAGQMPTPLQVANSLQFSLDLAGDGNYEFARQLLEKLRRSAPFLALERGETPLGDRYTVDLGKRVGDLARRQVQSAAQTLGATDARLSAHAARVSRGEPLPLAEIGNGRSFALNWQNSTRQIAVALCNGATPESLANRVLAAREWGVRDEAFLLLLPPFAHGEFEVAGVARLLADERSRAALWVWKPRPPARDEWELCREAAAAHMAANDPALLENRRGRAILELLERESPARDEALARIVARLFLEGKVVLGSGVSIDASELRRADTFVGLLESLAEFAFPQLFPKWSAIAPRARLLTTSNAHTVCLEILRQSREDGLFSPAIERLARHIALPMGIARARGARFVIEAGAPELLEALSAQLNEGATYSVLEATFAKNEWGLPPESTAMAVSALLRSGQWAAFDTRGQEMAPAQIGLPLRKSVHLLRPGRLPESASWTKLAVLARELWDGKLGSPSFEEAARIALELDQWQEETARRLEIARARAAQLRRALGGQGGHWRVFEQTCESLGQALSALPHGVSCGERLTRAADLDALPLSRAQSEFRRFSTALENRLPAILAIHALLNAPDLATPPELRDDREWLLERLGAGESVLFDDELAARAELWNAHYGRIYSLWHGAQNDAARGASLRRLASSDSIRALERLLLLKNRATNDLLAVRSEIQDEISKLCPRDGSLERGRATCSSCALPLGQRVRLKNEDEWQIRAHNALEVVRSWLRDPKTRAILEREDSPLLQWDEAGDTLLPLLTVTALRTLDRALEPRRRVTRSLDALSSALRPCLTRGECEAAFAAWMDDGDGIRNEDEIEWR